jgi:uncharacterized protein
MATLDHPFHFDSRGKTAVTGEVDHIRDLIEQVLFTSPGERVMRPDFGAGLLALVFEPNSVTLAATAQVLVKSALQQHLSHLIAVSEVEIENTDAVLQVSVSYLVLDDSTEHIARMSVPGSSL